MLSFSPVLDGTSKTPIYLQLYEYIRQQILNGHFSGGAKLPSLRKLAEDLHISKNTVESAYQQLEAEGYLESVPKEGYHVVELHSLLFEPREIGGRTEETKEAVPDFLYDLTCKGIDGSIFNEKLWKKVTNDVLKEEFQDLMHYGNPQGELELREEIVKYVFENRGFLCLPEQIIIGAGTQYCLSLLCQMLRKQHTSIAVEDPGTNWISSIFESFCFEMSSLPVGPKGYNIEALEKESAKLVFVTPSHQFLNVKTIPVANRISLLNWAYQNNGYIIEDDYDSEVRYLSDAIPSLKSLDKNDRVIYLGSFSKIFIPALRISYLILPPKLLELYQTKYNFYEQTTSRVHQKAFTRYMKEGYFDSHIRKLKKNLRYKYKIVMQAFQTYFGDRVEIIFVKGGLSIMVACNLDKREEELIEMAQKAGVRIRSVTDYYQRHMEYHQQGRPRIYLSFKGVMINEIEPVIKLLSEVWFGNDLRFREGECVITKNKK